MRMRKHLLLIAIFAALGVTLVAGAFRIEHQNDAAAPPPAGKVKRLQVTASFYPLWYFSSRIGGDRATVTNVTPSGAEPHDYEPTAQDAARIESSDLLVLNGGGL